MMEQSMPPLAPQRIQEPPSYAARGRELIYGGILLLASLLVCNFTAWGGLNLGFVIGTALCIGCSVAYLWKEGVKKSYALSILGLCLGMLAGFARSDDDFVKAVLCGFMFVGVNLSLTLLAGRQRRSSGSIRSLADGFYGFFSLGFGRLDVTLRSTKLAIRNGGSASKNVLSVLLGLGIALPVLIVVVPLLVKADAAFDGLMQLLPEFRLDEAVVTLIFAGMLFPVLYSQGMSLRLGADRPLAEKQSKGLAALTVNTVLIAICGVYLVYLLSQLAYFVGGFAGILPEKYTLAQYARRGFFEMAWLSAINLGLLVSAMALSREKRLLTKLLCLFIGLVTVFFVAAASAKMFLYIEAYGLTRLRVLTQIVMLFLGLTTAIVCIWLFVPKLQYMQAVLLTALAIGTCVIWADVDTQVARYNVTAYLSGTLEKVDVAYLSTLGDGAVPWLRELSQSADPEIAAEAKACLQDRPGTDIEDFRQWNYVSAQANRE